MNVVIYARFSSHSQTEQSIEGQLKTCYEYANANGYKVIGEYIDRAISGTTDNRPDFQRMIADSSKHLFSGVLVYQLDRFARNRYDSANYKAALKKNGVRVLSARENITDDASGILIESVLEGMAEYYSAELAQKIKRGMDINGQKCLCTGGGTALGFKVDKEKRFQIDEETAPIVREIFNMYANGKTVTEIITMMNERHIVTSRGNAFNKNSLRKMLRNKRYIGTYTYCGTETPGGIPRIVDDETFNQVQEMLDKNKKAPARARAKAEYLLTTKLFCGHCKEMMTGLSGTSHTTAKHNYYICNNRKKKLCNKKNVRKEFIEELVLAECRKLLTDKNISRIAKEVAKVSEQEAEPVLLQQMRRQLADIERKKKNLLAAVMECDIENVRKTLYEQLALIEKQGEDLEFQIAREMAGQVRLTAPEIKFFLAALKKGNPDTAKHKKTLIAIFVNAIYLYDDKITLIFNSGDKPVTITNDLLNDIEKQAEAVPVGERFVYETNASTKLKTPSGLNSRVQTRWCLIIKPNIFEAFRCRIFCQQD
ncbi:MAG: recombinase family protein [Ruminococcaceae bacterium]|nr:recombinase family protein [Oscillospiraceae bacterium]